MILADLSTVDFLDRISGSGLSLRSSTGLPEILPRLTKKRPSVPSNRISVVTFAGDDHLDILWHVDLDLEGLAALY